MKGLVVRYRNMIETITSDFPGAILLSLHNKDAFEIPLRSWTNLSFGMPLVSPITSYHDFFFHL